MYTITRRQFSFSQSSEEGVQSLKEEYEAKGREIPENAIPMRIPILTERIYRSGAYGIVHFSESDMSKIVENFINNVTDWPIAFYKGHPATIQGSTINTDREAVGWIYSDDTGMYVADISYEKNGKEVTERAIVVEGYWNEKGAELINSHRFKYTSAEIASNYTQRDHGLIKDLTLQDFDDNLELSSKSYGLTITGVALTNSPVYYMPSLTDHGYEFSEAIGGEITNVEYDTLSKIVENGPIYLSNGDQTFSISQKEDKINIKKVEQINYYELDGNHQEGIMKNQKGTQVAESVVAGAVVAEAAVEDVAVETGSDESVIETAIVEAAKPAKQEVEIVFSAKPSEIAELEQLKAEMANLKRLNEQREIEIAQFSDRLAAQKEEAAILRRSIEEQKMKSYAAEVDSFTVELSNKNIPEAAVKTIRAIALEVGEEQRNMKYSFSNAATGEASTENFIGVLRRVTNAFTESMFRSPELLEDDHKDSHQVNPDKEYVNPLL